jgi:transcriptional regulator with XRE-family HTH domain
MTLAGRLKLIRESLGMSQSTMAKAADSSLPSWQGYEAGKNVPGGKVFEALARMRFNVNWLLTGEGEMRLEGRPVLASQMVLAGFAEKLRQIRGEESIESFAETLNCTPEDIIKAENGEAEPGYGFICELLFEYDINPSWLLEDNGPIKKWNAECKPNQLDEELIKYVIEIVEDIFENRNLHLPPKKKSELIMLLYEELHEDRMKKEDLPSNVIRLSKFAA